MDTEQMIDIIVAYCERAHPKSCSNCGRSFPDLRAYFEGTDTIGTPQCYDAANESAGIGTLTYVNCRCRSTLAIRADAETTADYPAFLEWLAQESAASGTPPDVVLERLRVLIRERVLRGGEGGERGAKL